MIYKGWKAFDVYRENLVKYRKYRGIIVKSGMNCGKVSGKHLKCNEW